jgi:hypothetical protein
MQEYVARMRYMLDNDAHNHLWFAHDQWQWLLAVIADKHSGLDGHKAAQDYDYASSL